MRSSDWRSDVCSSDLTVPTNAGSASRLSATDRRGTNGEAGVPDLGQEPPCPGHSESAEVCTLGMSGPGDPAGPRGLPSPAVRPGWTVRTGSPPPQPTHTAACTTQPGRATWRARVCTVGEKPG